MKIRNIILSMLLCSIAFGAGKKLTPETIPLALKKKASPVSPGRIAVVSVRRIFEKNSTEQQLVLEGEQKRMQAELEKILSEAKAFRADMETRKPDSTDYVNLNRKMIEKEALYDAKKKFFQQDLASREQQWIKKLYQEVVAATEKVAKQKGLALILAEEGEQILFHADEMNITDEVLAAMDKAN